VKKECDVKKANATSLRGTRKSVIPPLNWKPSFNSVKSCAAFALSLTTLSEQRGAGEKKNVFSTFDKISNNMLFSIKKNLSKSICELSQTHWGTF